MDEKRESDREPRPAPEIEPPTTLLLRCWHDGEASVIRQLLSTYGIACQVVSHVSHNVFPVAREIRILVSPSRAEEARVLIAEHRRDGLRVLPGGAEEALD